MLGSFLVRRAFNAASLVGRLRACALLCALGACSVEPSGTAQSSWEPFESGVVPGSPDDGSGPDNPPEDARVVPVPDAGGVPHRFDASVAADTGASEDAFVPRDAGQPEPDAAVEPTGCRLDGRYALQVAFDVSWVGTEIASIIPLIDPGRGELSFVALVELQTTPSGIDALLGACSVSVPGFVATISRDRYQASLDDAIWDGPSMPVFSTTLQASCREPGCAFTSAPLHGLIGAALGSTDAPWPASASEGEWPDHDADGEPGVTSHMLAEQGYVYPPLDLISSRQVRDLMLGLRVLLSMSGTLDSCDELHGETPGSSVETRAVGCQATAAPARCNATEIDFLNENLPVWMVREGRFQARRLAPDADCKRVRREFAPNAP